MKFINLLKKNKEKEPVTYDVVYGSMVEKELKKYGYSLSKIQAIINNYINEPENEKYIQEFKDLQETRKQCKIIVKAKLG